MRIEKLVRTISIWYQIDGQKVQNLNLNMAYACMRSAPSPDMALDSENHALWDELTHAGRRGLHATLLLLHPHSEIMLQPCRFFPEKTHPWCFAT